MTTDRTTDTQVAGGETGDVRIGGLRLAKFIIALVLDDRALNTHLNDPARRRARMRAVELSEEEQRLLDTPCFLELCSYLAKAGTGPAPNTEGSGGGAEGGEGEAGGGGNP